MFNLFKKKVVEVELESPRDIITPQVKSDMEYIKQIYDKLGIMWDNGDSRVKKAVDDGVVAGYRRYEDDYINLIVDSCDDTSRIYIDGKIIYPKNVTRSFKICNTHVIRKDHYYDKIFHSPIEWNVSNECKVNVMKHIEETILNDKQYDSLQMQFCRRISNKCEES